MPRPAVDVHRARASGFNPDLAARDNVVMNGIMLGLTPREARKRYESVIEFAELEEFKDLKLKNYSSGMHVRLAFSVAIQVDADILMIDEVLAVGDAAFQQKCFDVFNDLRDRGRTIIFVTHDMGSLQRFCHRALLLERGDPVYLGEPHEVADRYLELNFGRDPESMGAAAEGHAGDGEARVDEVWLENQDGERLSTVPQHQRVTLNARVLFMVDVTDPSASVYIYNEEHRAVVIATTWMDNERTGQFAAGEEVVFCVHVRQRPRPRTLLAGIPARAPRVGPGRDRSLRGQLLVRRHGTRRARWAGRPAGPLGGQPRQRTRRTTDTSMSVQAPPYESLGRPIHGPGALTGDWRRFWHLTFNIAVMQWKLRFFGSALGYLWQLVRPLLLFLVLYVFFTKVAQVGTAVAPATTTTAPSCSASIVLFTFFGEATMGAVRSVVDNEALVRKIQFPRMVIPLSIVLLSFFNLCLNLIVVTIFALLAGVRPMLTWLEVPLIIGAAGRPVARESRCCCRRCSSTSGTSSRSGRCSTRSSSTPRRSSSRSRPSKRI